MLKKTFLGLAKACRRFFMLPVRFLRWCLRKVVVTFTRLKELGLRGMLRILLAFLRNLTFSVMLVSFIALVFMALVTALVITWNVGPAEMLDLPLVNFMNGAATIMFGVTSIITWRFTRWVLGKTTLGTSEED